MSMRNAMAMIVAAMMISAMMPEALAQDEPAVTPAWLKEKGAKLLTKADLEALLPGSVYDDVGDRFTNSYTNDRDGSLSTYHTPRIGGGGTDMPWRASGTWRVSDQGQYCVDYRFRVTEVKYCMYVWQLGNDYYVTFGRGDQSRGRKAKISK